MKRREPLLGLGSLALGMGLVRGCPLGGIQAMVKSSPIVPLILAIGWCGSAVAEQPMKPVLTMEAAQKTLNAALQEASRLKAPGGSIAIVDDGGHLILLHRMDGMMPATPPIAWGKARTAAIFRTPTLTFENITRGGRVSMLKIDGFMPMQGGIPIWIKGHVVGAIGVSGAASAPQDEEIAIAGAKGVGGYKPVENKAKGKVKP